MDGKCQMCNTPTREGITECFMDQFGKVLPLSCDKSKGFYLHNGECKNIDIEGYFNDDLTGWYTKCDCNCKTCAGSPRNCVQCPFGFIPVEGGVCSPDVSFTAAWSPDFSNLTLEFNNFVQFYDPSSTEVADTLMCVNPREKQICE